jgi:ABC-type antimicrobial peptide transport system permease subunit
MASVGLYGTVAFATTQRVQEIGVRRALGAQSSDIIGLVVQQAARPVVMGCGLGLMAAYAVARLLTALLFGVGSLDPLAYGSVVLLLSAVAVLAVYVPARRATRIDPMAALRYE